MKSWKTLACLLVLLTAVPAVHADEDFAVFNLGIGGQYWDAKDIDDGNGFEEDGLWGGNLIIRIRPIKYLGIDIRAGVSANWEGKSYRVGGRRYEEDETFTCVPVEVGLIGMLPLGPVVTLYAGPGMGYYFYNYNYSEHSSRHGHHYRKEYDEDIDLENDFGWYAVGGATFQICRHFSLFGEVRYTDTETELEDFDSVKIDCSGIAGQIGVIFDF